MVFVTPQRNNSKRVITHSRMFIITLVGRIPASARIRPEIDFLLHNQKMLGEEEEDGTSSQVTPHTRGLASAPEQEELFHSRPGTF